MHVKIDQSVNNYVDAINNKENTKQEYILKYSKSSDGSIVISAEKKEKGVFSSLFKKPENNLDTIFNFIMSTDEAIESSLKEPAKFAQILAEKMVKYSDNRDSKISSSELRTPAEERIKAVATSIKKNLDRPIH